jgi:hypothetical protein
VLAWREASVGRQAWDGNRVCMCHMHHPPPCGFCAWGVHGGCINARHVTKTITDALTASTTNTKPHSNLSGLSYSDLLLSLSSRLLLTGSAASGSGASSS